MYRPGGEKKRVSTGSEFAGASWMSFFEGLIESLIARCFWCFVCAGIWVDKFLVVRIFIEVSTLF